MGVNLRLLLKTGAVVLVLALLATQCTSATLPPPLQPEQRALVESTRLPVTIGVAPYRFPVYSERLVEALRATRMFDHVALLEEVPDPDLVAEVTRGVHGTATIPVFTAVSLGLVPTTVEEEWGEVFLLRRPEGDEAVDVDFRYRGPSMLGWWGVVENRKRDRTWRSPRSTQRFHDALAFAIAARSDAIRALLAD